MDWDRARWQYKAALAWDYTERMDVAAAAWVLRDWGRDGSSRPSSQARTSRKQKKGRQPKKQTTGKNRQAQHREVRFRRNERALRLYLERDAERLGIPPGELMARRLDQLRLGKTVKEILDGEQE